MKSFAIYFHGSVKYNGRALGILDSGNFLLLRKNDGSVQVHAGAAIKPRNYMGAGTKMKGNFSSGNGVMTFMRKKETIEVTMDHIHFCEYLENWSEKEVKLRQTEKELVLKLFWNWPDYFDVTCFKIEMEAPIDGGAVDLLGTGFDNTHHVIECKKRKTTTSDVFQLLRYVLYYREQGLKVHGYLAAPEIGTNALKCLELNKFEYVSVTF